MFLIRYSLFSCEVIDADFLILGCVHRWEELWSHDLGVSGDDEGESEPFVCSDVAGYEDEFEE